MRVLQHLQGQYSFEIEIVDVDLDPSTRDEYGLVIPVVVIDGKAPLTAPISQRDLEHGVARLSRRRGGLRDFFRRS